MIIRFNKALVNKFDLNNFSAIVGSIGLYFIFLDDLLIPYPFKESKLIYIGMSESRANSIGNRLRDHIAGRSNNAGIMGYYKKWDLSFTYLDYEFLKQVFEKDIEFIETFFLEDFANYFGVYPICNNRRGSFNKEERFNDFPQIDWEFFGG
ncbi:MAG: hypothetical protein KKA79_06335 [Nanoarchaeota archaeon]|nr:hypothetical protein [Nanoarchaeota archaeon]